MKWVFLPALVLWGAVAPVHGKLVVSGPLQRGPQCGYLTVDPASRHSSFAQRDCATGAVRVGAQGRSPWTPVYVGRRLAFRYEDSSTSRPVSATSGDTLWVYDVRTDHGAVIQRWSLRTGRLEQELRFPVTLWRPVIAANADGAWLMAAVNGGIDNRQTSPLFHVTTRVVAVPHSAARAAMWMTTQGRTLWLETVDGTSTFRLRRYDGTRGRVLWTRKSSLLVNTVFGGGVSYGAGALWAIAAPYCAKTLRVVRIDGRTGATRTVAETPLLDCNQYGGGTVYDGAYWFINGNELFRTPLRTR
jgi:hypothetical protein